MAEITNLKEAVKQRRIARDEVRRAKHLIPNGEKAFDMCSDMETDLSQIKHCASTLFLLAHRMTDEREQDALYLLANTLDDAVKTAEEKRGKIFNATWGYRNSQAQ